MTDRFSGVISIGGTLTPELADKLAKRLIQEEVCCGWDERSFQSVREVRAHLSEAVRDKQTARFYDSRARYGAFEELEKWLTEQKIAWKRHSEAHYAYDAELVWFDPETGAGQCYASQNEIDEFVHLSQLEDALEILEVDRDQSVFAIAADLIERHNQFVEKIKQIVRENKVPALAPLYIELLKENED